MLALATCSEFPDLSPDDRLLLTALHQRGTAAAPAVWSDATLEWESFDGVVIRSCWDYHLRVAEFLAWLDRLERSAVPVLNPAALVRWNSAKTYLRDLGSRGVATIPTRWVERGEGTTLRSVLAEEGWEHAVVKPAVSASAHGTWRTSAARTLEDEARFRASVNTGSTLVQRFEETVLTDGEWSMIFLDGEYSHAVRKRPRDGDFRVQSEHGGSFLVERPPAHAIRAGAVALAAAEDFGGASAYARVDGCIVDGAYVLMELELIEPLLYLETRGDAAAALADAVLRRMRRGS